MQRSRRALLQRRAGASENLGNLGSKHLYYKVSLSLVLLLWGLIFLLNSLISHGNGYRDELESDTGEPKLLKAFEFSRSGDDLETSVINPDKAVNSSNSLAEKIETNNTEVFVEEDDKSSPSTRRTAQAAEEISDSSSRPEKETHSKSSRASLVAPLGLDEFKSRTIAAREKPLSSQTGSVVHRLEPGGKEYNYASSKKGAKVIDYNKEAKGAFNIIDKDKDKYLRNPCSAEEKFVVIELSEETLVSTIEIGNFEHYSSNLKDFELYSSQIYPTENWVKLGSFTAQNVKQAKRFTLPEPKWMRYLKLNMLSHYGSEFYCTLSVVEVYGVDAVEKMLEDLISVEMKRSEPEEQSNEHVQQQESTNGDDSFEENFTGVNAEAPHESLKSKDVPKSTVSDSTSEIKPSQVARMPGDTVLKILLQKVQSLDLNFSLLERYLEELNTRYARIFKDFDDDMSNKEVLLETIRSQIKNLQGSTNIVAKEIADLHSWKSSVSLQLEQLAEDNKMLRLEFKTVRSHWIDMENRGLAVIFLTFILGCTAAAKLFIDTFSSISGPKNLVNSYRTSPAWFFLLLSSSIIAFILAI